MEEFNVESLNFPITTSQLLVDTGISCSSSDMKRLIYGTTIMLENSPLNSEMSHIFGCPDELKGKHLKIGRRVRIKFV